MKVYWLEQTDEDLPPGNAWLSPTEQDQLNALRFAKRRADWRLGRWTAKHALAACLQLSADLHDLAKIEVRPSASGAPEIFLGDRRAPATISLSHRAGRAVCAVVPFCSALGCDLELVEPHSDAFIADYFATEEQALIAQAAPEDRPWLVTLLWSAKESALKALRAGLRLDTRRVIAIPGDALAHRNKAGTDFVQKDPAQKLDLAAGQPEAHRAWHPLRVRHVHGQTFLGWWQMSDSLVRTLVAAPPPPRPIFLSAPHSTAKGPALAGSDQSQAA